jgi:two-component system, chemotaxis family, protein-glutamate methylesterase/glutaminase
MPQRDIIVIGASAGGVEALRELVSQFPAGFPAAIFAVIHMYPRTRSFLPDILTRAGCLPAIQPEDGDAIEHGKIYLAPPDRHLILERDHVDLSSGPKEQHQRPCINVTFRSAALAYGERVAGVVLTGQMDDGTAGLWEIKRRGGVAIVQNPEEALFPSMPLSALREIEADYTVSLAEMGRLLCRLATRDGEQKIEANEFDKKDMEPRLTDLTCPDCRGTIWEVPRGNGTEYRCRVGHTYSAKSMLAEHFAAQEKALYAAVVALEEGASLANRLANGFDPELRECLLTEARDRGAEAEVVRRVLSERTSFSIE